MKPYQSIITLSLALIILTGYQFLGAAWTAPTAVPPEHNTEVPINVGSTTQNKAGNFMANIVAAATSTWSPEYCDELGNNCWDPATGATGGGSNFGGLYTQISGGACAKPNPYTGSCTCPTGYTDSVLANGVSGTEQYFHQCWNAGGTLLPSLGKGAIETMRGITGNFLPPPPAGLSEWPDYVMCDINAGQKHYFMPFSRIFIVGTDQIVSYSPDGSGAGGYSVRSDGTYYSRSAVMANCGPNSVGSDIVSICNAGYCGYY